MLGPKLGALSLTLHLVGKEEEVYIFWRVRYCFPQLYKSAGYKPKLIIVHYVSGVYLILFSGSWMSLL
jgi:hypothetical protein